MFNSECIFCKIIQKQIPSKIIKENEYILVIEDISPKAPIHYLILPKKHIININNFSDQDNKFAYEMVKAARNVAKDLQKSQNLKEPIAFNLISNNGAAAGQCVFHMHWHFISGKNIFLNGSKL